MTLASINPLSKTYILTSNTSLSVALPLTGSPTTCLLTNLSTEGQAYVALSTSAATVASGANGACIARGQSLALTVGANTYLSAIGGPGGLDIQMGT